jgi:preprotein translocase SecE subunit
MSSIDKPAGKATGKSSASQQSEGGSSAGIVGQTSTFFRESVEELKKVQHPTRQETVQASLVTLLIMVLVSIVLSLFDFVFGRALNALIG